MQCHKFPLRKVLRRVYESSSLTHGLRGVYWRPFTSKEDRALPHIMRRASFFSASRIRMDLTRRTVCLCSHGLRVLRSSWIWFKTSRPTPYTDSSSSLPPPHVGRQDQNWNHQHRSCVIFDDESRVSLYHSGRRVQEFHLFLGCNFPIAFQQHDENSVMPIIVVEAGDGSLSAKGKELRNEQYFQWLSSG